MKFIKLLIIFFLILTCIASCSNSTFKVYFDSRAFKAYDTDKYLADKVTSNEISRYVEKKFIWYNVSYDVRENYEGKVYTRIIYDIKTEITDFKVGRDIPDDFRKCILYNLKKIKLKELSESRSSNGIYDFIICINLDSIRCAKVKYR